LFTDSVAVRAFATPFAETFSVIVACPCPEVGDTPIHDESDAAVHEHSRAALTVTGTLPPDAGTVATDPPNETAQRTTSGLANSLTLVEPQATKRTRMTDEMIGTSALLSRDRTAGQDA